LTESYFALLFCAFVFIGHPLRMFQPFACADDSFYLPPLFLPLLQTFRSFLAPDTPPPLSHPFLFDRFALSRVSLAVRPLSIFVPYYRFPPAEGPLDLHHPLLSFSFKFTSSTSAFRSFSRVPPSSLPQSIIKPSLPNSGSLSLRPLFLSEPLRTTFPPLSNAIFSPLPPSVSSLRPSFSPPFPPPTLSFPYTFFPFPSGTTGLGVSFFST